MKRTFFLAGFLLMTSLLFVGCGKGSDYKKAMALYEEGNYEEAAMKFTELGDYESSKDMVVTCNYEAAKILFEEGSYENAKKAFKELGDYENCSDYITECDYYIASDLYDSGEYEKAIDIFETISDFNDSSEKIKAANKELMYINYADVLSLLDGNSWFCNGGSDVILNRISFNNDQATIAQVSFDGNGKHDNGANTFSYTVDDSSIILSLIDGSEFKIAYSISEDQIVLGNHEYLTITEIEEGIQGYWKVISNKGNSEENIYFDKGNVTAESATVSLYNSSEYFYYGPYEGTYTLNFGGFNTDMRHGGDWFYNIIDGVPTILYYYYVGTKSDGFPGQNGYDF